MHSTYSSSRTSSSFKNYQGSHEVNNNETGGVDWNSLEAKFNQLLEFLNAPVSNGIIGASLVHQREVQQDNFEVGLEAIIEVALSETSMLLQVGDFSNAIIGGLKCLKFVQDLYGSNALEQIEPYFLLAKAHQYLKKYQQAEEFLSIANWTIMKVPDCPPHIKAELHLNFGLLYVTKGSIDKATDHLATSVYYLALMHGSEHLITSFGYFNLGNVFATQGKIDKAVDFLRKVIDIWYNQLIKSIDKENDQETIIPKEDPSTSMNRSDEQIGYLKKKFDKKKIDNSLESLDEEKIFEANRMFEHILSIELDRFGEHNIETGRAFMVYGLYLYWVGEVIKSKTYMEKAQSSFKYVLGDKHAQLKEIERIILQIYQ